MARPFDFLATYTNTNTPISPGNNGAQNGLLLVRFKAKQDQRATRNCFANINASRVTFNVETEYTKMRHVMYHALYKNAFSAMSRENRFRKHDTNNDE